MKATSGNQQLQLFLLAIMASGIAMLGYLTPRSDTLQLLLLASIISACGYWLYRITTETDVSSMLTASVVLRLLLFFMLPNLSDDYFRFIWDGRLLVAGEAPFAALPRELLGTAIAAKANLTPALFAQLNSPDYFTVYPPVAQFTFWLAALVGGKSVYCSILVLRSIQLLAEAGTLWLLYQLLKNWKLPTRRILLYALNPLVILELVGNLHAEALLLFFLVAAIYLMQKGRQTLSAFCFGLSIAAKLIPILLLPLLIQLLGWRRALRYGLIAGLTVLVLFIPLLQGGFFAHFFSSIDLYFQKFEFNASIYYVVRKIGYAFKGYNIIAVAGPALLILAILLIAVITWWKTKGELLLVFLQKSILVLLVYYLCASIVHPWYVIPMLLLSVIAPFRFPIVWAVVVWLSYATYGNAAYTESTALLFVEYALVFAAVFIDLREMYAKQRQKLTMH